MDCKTSYQILIADDDPVVSHIVTSILSSAGFTVSTVKSGKECIELFKGFAVQQSYPHLLLLDLQLLDMSGKEVLDVVRGITNPYQVPVAIMSANSESEIQQTYPDLKADLYLEKPFTPQKIISAINDLLAKKAT